MVGQDIVLDESFVSVRTEDTESGSDEDVRAPVENRRKKNRKYEGEETFRSLQELRKWTKDNGWNSKGKTVKDDGTVIHAFVCKYGRRTGSGEKCAARMRCEEVAGLFTVKMDKEHGEHPDAKRRLPEGLKEEIKRLLDELPSITAQVILRSVQTRFPTVTLRQIQVGQ
uniref:Transposase n=2 Tax=Bursaphelenchus xylophilus TaxID=6326 RepID=A0A1I7SJX1_BURXY